MKDLYLHKTTIETNRFLRLIPFVAVLLVTIYFMIIIIKYPLVGVEVEETNGKWIINKIYENGWAIHQSIEIGDSVKEINGKNPEEHPTVKRYGKVEMADALILSKPNNEMKYFSIKYKHLDIQYIMYLLLPLFFSTLTIILSGLLAKKKDKASMLLIYFLLSIGVGYLSLSVSIRGDFIGYATNSITLLGSLIFFIHFLREYFLGFDLVFVKSKSIWFLYIMYLLILISEMVLVFSVYTYRLHIFELMIFLVVSIYVIVSLIRFFLKYKNSNVGNVIQILSVILTTGFLPFILCYVLPTIFFDKVLLSAEVSALFLMIIPIGFIYLMLAEKMLDVEFFLNRVRYYSLLSFPFSLLFDFIINLLSRERISTSFNIIIILLLFICMNVFLYVKEFIDYKLKSHLFSSKSNIETNLYQFIQKAKCETKVNDLMCNAMNEIKNVINVKNIFCVQLLKGNNGLVKALSNEESLSSQIKRDLECREWDTYMIGSLLDLEDGYALVIEGDSKSKSIIIFTMNKIQTNLNVEEKEWLEALAFFTSLIGENFQLIEGLLKKMEGYKGEKLLNKEDHPFWLAKILFLLSEKERTNLSIDLHDSVLQEQLLLLREIDKMTVKATDLSIRNDLLHFKEMILDNIHLIRETCNELRPPLLDDLGLNQSIQSLVKQTKLRCDFLLREELDAAVVVTNKEYQLVLYRVVQELLNNAMKHSLALNVKLSLFQKGQTLFLLYEDDGKGFDLKKLNENVKTMGLFGIRERVKSIGGKIKIKSEKGQGMKVSIEVITGVVTNDKYINSR